MGNTIISFYFKKRERLIFWEYCHRAEISMFIAKIALSMAINMV